MKSWLTTHYPHPDPDEYPWHIYLQQKYSSVTEEIAEGDQVFFYEYKNYKALKSGKTHPQGREGIVRVAYVSGPAYFRDVVIEYADGNVVPWSRGVPTDNEDTDGFVGREDVLEVLGYQSGGYLRGFNAGKGIKQLTNSQADRLMKLFKQGK